LALASPAFAHEGHDHGAPDSAVRPNSAIKEAPARVERLSPTLVRVPVALQAGLRTQDVVGAAKAFAMTGRVVPDPAHSAQLRSPRGGRLLPPPKGFPALGQRVAKGEVIALLRPAFSRAEQSDLAAELARIEQQVLLSQQKLNQYSIGVISIPGHAQSPQYMQLKADYQSAIEREKAYRQGLKRVAPIRAPIAGVLSSADLSVGRVVRAGEQLGDLIEPRRFHVEAQLADLSREPPSAATAITPNGERIQLALLGVSRRLVGQSQLALYQPVNPPAGLATGQALNIVTAQDTPVALRVPRAALVSAGKRQMLWVQAAPERFEARAVEAKLTATHAEITAGVVPGERLVVQIPAALRATSLR
jgi:biotin carboxyl carrier protein